MIVDENQYMKVRRAREFYKDEKYCPPLNAFLGEHGFLKSHKKGDAVYYKSDDKLYLLKEYCHWKRGYFLLGKFQSEKSGEMKVHRFDNINCEDPVVLEEIDYFKKSVNKHYRKLI